MYETMNRLIIEWATERGIFKHGNPAMQAQKTLEEVEELIEAIAEQDEHEIIDAIGDIYVTLVIQAEMHGVSMIKCINQVYDEIKDRQGRMVGGMFVKDIPKDYAE